ncbi:hypothetical protein C8R47DRAFT_1094382 [Mycena vitilis]|nr:hypothetical protein C8R47DRAFT_1094382 [Mycena vitilis]
MGDPLVDDSWTIGTGMTMTVLQNPLRTRLHSTGKAIFSVPPHWHSMHDEHHVVLKGSLTITRGRGKFSGRRTVLLSHEEESFIVWSPSQGRKSLLKRLPCSLSTEQKILFSRNVFSRECMSPSLVLCKCSTVVIHTPNSPLGSDGLSGL